MTADESLTACADLVRAGDPDRFLATMAAPPAQRGPLFTLYAFNLEVARAPYLTEEPVIAEMRLQWWRDVVAAAGSGAARAHEVAAPLHALIAAQGLPVPVLDTLIAVRRWDCWREAQDDLTGYLEATGAGLMWLAAKALGAGAEVEPASRAAGWASGLANYLRAVPALQARGRLPLADSTRTAIAALAGQGLERLAQARAGPVGPAAAALRSAWLAGPILRQAARDPSAVTEGRLEVAEVRRRGGMLWRSLRGGW